VAIAVVVPTLLPILPLLPYAHWLASHIKRRKRNNDRKEGQTKTKRKKIVVGGL